ncbi:hypothetical protein GQ457_18G010690 [Hibiscus cannabinus]
MGPFGDVLIGKEKGNFNSSSSHFTPLMQLPEKLKIQAGNIIVLAINSRNFQQLLNKAEAVSLEKPFIEEEIWAALHWSYRQKLQAEWLQHGFF